MSVSVNLGRDVKRIKINSGGPFYIGSSKLGSGSNFFKEVGIVESGHMTDVTTGRDKREWTGNKFRLQDERSADIMVVLEQTSQDEARIGDLLKGEFVQLFFVPGKMPGGKSQCVFVKEAQVMFSLDLNAPSGQIVRLDFSIIPQNKNISLTYASATRSGTNEFYALFDMLTSQVVPPTTEL